MNPAFWSPAPELPPGRIVPPPATPVPAPEAPRRVRVGMPHLDPGGLSEGWLLRDAGDRHWEAIGRRLGVATDEIVSDAGERLYPTVVAVRARYEGTLAAARENQVLDFATEVVPCGRACAHGRVVATVPSVARARFALELLTTFAARGPDGALRTTVPAPHLARRWGPVGVEPAIAGLARAARRGERVADPFCGPALEVSGAALGEMDYEPSPYADYNGAGLLYFAAYVTIADSLERRMVRRLWLDNGVGGQGAAARDWALATSPVRRDVFYYENLPLGVGLRAGLLSFDRDANGVTTRVRLSRVEPGAGEGEGGRPMADVVTRRAFVGAEVAR